MLLDKELARGETWVLAGLCRSEAEEVARQLEKGQTLLLEIFASILRRKPTTKPSPSSWPASPTST